MKTLFVAILFIAQSNLAAAAPPKTVKCPGDPAKCKEACETQVNGTETGSDGGPGTGYCTFNPRNGNFPKKGEKAPEKK